MKCDNLGIKNIMYIFNDISLGGATQSLLETLVEIKNYVNPVVIIRNDTSVEDKFIELGVKVYKICFSTDYVKIGSADAEQRMCDIRQSYEAALQLLPIIQKENIQLIHINSSVSSFAAITALMAHVPYIWHVRELLQEHFGYEFLNEDLKVSLYKKADKLIAISDYVKNRYYERYGLEMLRLYNGLNINRFKKDISVRNKWENTFIVAAMITPEKGQWDVIRATELLVEKGYDDLKVNIVGAGSVRYVWALKKYIKRKKLDRNIHIMPFQDDLAMLRSQSSYAISCSQNEALGRVTIESMLAGNLVIGARSGGTIEIIGSNEERGFLYELGNSESLAHTMETVINCTKEEKIAIVQKAQEYAENTFNSKQYCGKLLEIYDTTIASFVPYKGNNLLNALEEYYYFIINSKNCEIRDKAVPYKKSAMMFPVVLKWLEIRQNGHFLDEYFRKNHIQTIGIYGMGVLGCRLYDELVNSDIQIKYLMDRNPKGMDKIFKFSILGKEELDVDAIVVTVISSEKQVIDEIKTYGYENVIGLSAILNNFNYI